MRVVVFFVCLCFLLLKGYHRIDTGIHHYNTGYVSAENLEKTQRVIFKSNHQRYFVIKDANLNANDDFPIIDDNEHEDINSLPSRKYRLLANYYLTLSSLSILTYFHSRFEVSQPFGGHLSDKYITHSVLRI